MDAFQSAVAALQGGNPTKALALCQSLVLTEPDNPRVLHLLGVCLHQTGKPAEGRDYVSRSLELSPHPTTAYNLGAIHLALEQWEQAAQSFRQSVDLAPNTPLPLLNLGKALTHLRRWSEAESAYRTYLDLCGPEAEAIASLANCLYLAGRMDEALVLAEQSLSQTPTLPGAWINRSNCFGALGDWTQAISDLEQALKLAPHDSHIRSNLGMARLRVGDFGQGWPDYEHRLPPHQRLTLPPGGDWLAQMRGRTILVFAEQGLGDTFQFCRYLPLLAKAGVHVIFECQPALAPLLSECGLECQLLPRGQARPPHDVAVALLSLPLAFQTKLHTIPAPAQYIACPPERAEHWRRKLAQAPNRLRVGVNWQGGTAYQLDHFRSVPFGALAPILAEPKAAFFVLHRGVDANSADLSAIATFDESFDSKAAFVDTAAVMANLDLVITSDTAIAHLAGALGTPTWLMLSAYPDWRWLENGETTPYYPSMRLFRQSSLGDWDGLVQRMAVELARLADHPLGR